MRVLIIDGHPDPEPARFVHALADAYADGCEAGGHSLRRLRLADMDFPLLRSVQDWMEGEPCPVIAAAQKDISWAEHVVLFYPLWLGDVPALVKAFLEQVARPGFAHRYRGSGLPEKLLTGRSARVVVTMGMPSAFYRLFYFAHSLKSLKRNIFGFVGFAPVRHTIIGAVESSAKDRQKHLSAMRELGQSAR
ncbi:NAD(P)H-dependent oxidoreductase [Citromicrobium sp. JLT1363]|uniref:NAD(P)H-dependent oxidoreductase n=1 Tax=Citromicrobium sp. JLT1363 TaxID=517722 RepID=UPI000225DF3B|nr:NAD(P)H-dependent oxidoreductase [Citromicrobium sp. JLT1363]